ncbi:MAG: hypothetical protein HYY86_02965 [Candidatus Harrisonbacteria bacterium]|nr:hypothetical protein [Candidatus Harrisonbacteria bacterium]
MKSDGKPVWLFAFLKMDEIIDKWSLVISAPWINEQNRDQEFEYIINLLKENLNGEELSSIARISVLAKDSHLSQELMKKKTGDLIKEEQINGNIIHEGQILESSVEAQWPSNNLFAKQSS